MTKPDPRATSLRTAVLPTERRESPWTATFAFDDEQYSAAGFYNAPGVPAKFHTVVVDADRAVRVQGRWPRHRPDRWCDHCCHPFDPPGVPLAMAYNSRTDVFTVRGAFCSFACAKAHNCFTRHSFPSMPLAAEALSLFRKRCTGRMDALRAAPPRQALRVFGGVLSIDEFRSSGDVHQINLVPPKMILHEQLLEIRAHAAANPPPEKKRVTEAVQYTAELPRNETLRLKRHKPLPNKNALGRLGFLK